MTYQEVIKEWLFEAIQLEGSMSKLAYAVGAHQCTLRSIMRGKSQPQLGLLVYFRLKLNKDINILIDLNTITDIRYKVAYEISPFGIFSLKLRRRLDPSGLTKEEFYYQKELEFFLIKQEKDKVSIISKGSGAHCIAKLKILRKKERVYKYTLKEVYSKTLKRNICKKILVINPDVFYEVVESKDLPTSVYM